MTWAGIAIGVGGAVVGGGLSAYGASKSASDANKASDKAMQRDDAHAYDQMLRQAQALYGPNAEAYLRSALPREEVNKLFGVAAANPTFTPQQQQRVQAIDAEMAQLKNVTSMGRDQGARQRAQQRLNALVEERQGLVTEAGGSPGQAGRIDLNAFRAANQNNPGFIQKMTDLANQEEGKGQGLLGEFNADTERLAFQGDQNAREIGKYGEQERKRIALASDRALSGLNRQTQSRLLSSGLGNSTLLTQAMSGNTRNVREAEDNAMGSVSDRQLSLLSQIRQGNLSAAYGRAGQKTGLQSGLMDRNLNLRQAPISTELQVLTGPGMNPFAGQNSTVYYPGMSPSGTALSSVGNSLMAGSGLALGNITQGGSGGGGNTSGGTQRFDPYTGMPLPR